ncbi:similar to Saccharomyces cerevisiae YOR221C MCT1 Predicted malonyl-CoA:ACP transferase [Maudiozyma barnettii]|uniref:[acyl-carrier-protein] S-malonyltransferase n=1 Tax=Maudiozyma barnettii TaxID=61262 RepID=A0A8H2VDC0_9SACH|nr:[acyl-carrier-protein] S-malonyltransferase [Kazachstania barnettii]CAB4253222.1 similar to Saccharomyces cerevisiae YOR221C MCT1 Predicted malonyl-CoA:ACP transferase [Kazachstania barnettii]CAD1780242.1 similar to Saccharomyces cerevisiae YOR221C MCT1 Predicted malonyl-CoA:ACP transferase [Kazachstania barnettii]
MRLITFPGQGTPISVPILRSIIESKSKEFGKILSRNGPKTNELLQFIYKHPSSPGSIAVCSNLFYQLYDIQLNETYKELQYTNHMKKDTQDLILLGHSLGELTCLSINQLFSIRDLFNIANYRNELMVKYTEKYLVAHKMNHSTKFEMWALSSPRADDLPQQVLSLINNIRSTAPTIYIANVNSIKQCVVTGLVEDLEKLRIESQTKFPRLRVTELTNPNNVAFHNSNVLRPIQEPLYDYIWDILKLNQNHTATKLNYPIIGNLDGRISTFVHHAIERFVRCSSSTVKFTECYDTINEVLEIKDGAVNMGPSNVIYNLIKRNCDLDCYEFSSLDTVNKFQETDFQRLKGIKDNLAKESAENEI